MGAPVPYIPAPWAPLDNAYMRSYNTSERDGPQGAAACPETEVGMHLNTCPTTFRPAGPTRPPTPSASCERPSRRGTLTGQPDRHPGRSRPVPTGLRRRMPWLGQGLGSGPGRPLVAPLTLPRQGYSHRPDHAPGRRHPVERDQDRPRPRRTPPAGPRLPDLPVRKRRPELRHRILHKLPVQPPGIPLPQPDGRRHRGPRRPRERHRRPQAPQPRPDAHDRQPPRVGRPLLRFPPLEAGRCTTPSGSARATSPTSPGPRRARHGRRGARRRPQDRMGPERPHVRRRRARQVPGQPRRRPSYASCDMRPALPRGASSQRETWSSRATYPASDRRRPSSSGGRARSPGSSGGCAGATP